MDPLDVWANGLSDHSLVQAVFSFKLVVAAEAPRVSKCITKTQWYRSLVKTFVAAASLDKLQPLPRLENTQGDSQSLREESP